VDFLRDAHTFRIRAVHHTGMKTRMVFLLCAFVGVGLRADELSAGTSELVLSVTTNHYIPCGLTGRIDIAFADAVTMFQQPDLLDLIQTEYARQLPKGEKPEFTIKSCGTNAWSYVNKDKQYSEIHEISRAVTASNDCVDLVYYSRGKRFFGWFRAAIAVRLTRADAESSAYEVKVWAFPESTVSRFFARHLGLVEDYFREKTDSMTALTVKISHGLMQRLSSLRTASAE
jgi:hypothetical protein